MAAEVADAQRCFWQRSKGSHRPQCLHGPAAWQKQDGISRAASAAAETAKTAAAMAAAMAVAAEVAGALVCTSGSAALRKAATDRSVCMACSKAAAAWQQQEQESDSGGGDTGNDGGRGGSSGIAAEVQVGHNSPLSWYKSLPVNI